MHEKSFNIPSKLFVCPVSDFVAPQVYRYFIIFVTSLYIILALYFLRVLLSVGHIVRRDWYSSNLIKISPDFIDLKLAVNIHISWCSFNLVEINRYRPTSPLSRPLAKQIGFGPSLNNGALFSRSFFYRFKILSWGNIGLEIVSCYYLTTRIFAFVAS